MKPLLLIAFVVIAVGLTGCNKDQKDQKITAVFDPHTDLHRHCRIRSKRSPVGIAMILRNVLFLIAFLSVVGCAKKETETPWHTVQIRWFRTQHEMLRNMADDCATGQAVVIDVHLRDLSYTALVSDKPGAPYPHTVATGGKPQ